MSKEKEGKEKNNKKAPVLNLMEKRAAKEAKRNSKKNVNIPGAIFTQANEKASKAVKNK
jgi:hypothetical protein